MTYSQWKKMKRSSSGTTRADLSRAVTYTEPETTSKSKPMTYSQWKAQKRKTEKHTTTEGATAAQPESATPKTMTYSQWRAQKRERQTSGGNGVQAWAQESDELIKRIQAGTSQWFGQEQYDAHNREIDNMIGQAAAWQNQYADNQQITDGINAVVSALNTTRDYVTDYHDYYSMWDDEAAYKADEQNYKWYQTYSTKSYDELTGIIAGMEEGEEKTWLTNFAPTVMTQEDYDKEIARTQQQIEEMWALYERAYTIESWYTDYSTSPKESRTDPQSDAENLRIYNELVSKYGSLEELRLLIADRELSIKQLERNKKANYMVGVAQPYSENYDPDFAAKSGYVSTAVSPELGYYDVYNPDFYGTGGQTVGFDPVYEYINKNPDAVAMYSFDGRNYQHMSDEEIAIYNYYYATQGSAAAFQYLNLIQESLNYRAASDRFTEYQGRTGKEILFAVEAGLDKFASGFANFFNTTDDYIAQTDTQLMAGMVREDLADDSIPIWYNVRTGQWEKQILGQSAGQIAFDAVNSTANMLPSVLTSGIANMIVPGSGTIISSAMMGVSSAGNAYQEMLNLGYDQGQARAYSTLVGAAEAGLSYALSGISKLGGEVTGYVLQNKIAAIDSVVGQIAIKLGKNMISEGVEEALTEVLAPVFKNMLLHTNEDIDWAQVAYSGLMGALTANLFEGSGVIKENVGYYKTGKGLQTIGITAEQLAAAGKMSADEAVKQLAGHVDENTGAYTLGKLFHGMNASMTDLNKTSVTKALESMGVQSKDANVMAEAFSAVVEGASLNDAQIRVLEANDLLSRVILDALQPDTDGLSDAQAPLPVSENSVPVTGENISAMTDEQLLQQAIGEMGSRPMDSKTYNALFGYKTQAEQVGRVESLLSQQQEILSRQQAEGATAYDIGKTQANIQKLQTLRKTRQKQLHATSQTPILQQVTEKTRSRLPQEPTTAENSRKNVLDISRKIDTIKAEGKIITDGSHIKNGKLQPNVTYQTGEHAYYCTTNENGLICRAFTESLQLKKHSGRKKHNPNTYGKQRGDHAGHLFGDRFGGSPELDNLVSQAARVNLSEYKKIENIWEGALRNGQSVSVDIALEYGDGNRPTSFTVTYVIDGESHTQYIKNQ